MEGRDRSRGELTCCGRARSWWRLWPGVGSQGLWTSVRFWGLVSTLEDQNKLLSPHLFSVTDSLSPLSHLIGAHTLREQEPSVPLCSWGCWDLNTWIVQGHMAGKYRTRSWNQIIPTHILCPLHRQTAWDHQWIDRWACLIQKLCLAIMPMRKLRLEFIVVFKNKKWNAFCFAESMDQYQGLFSLISSVSIPATVLITHSAHTLTIS